jgi:hypothetical protein
MIMGNPSQTMVTENALRRASHRHGFVLVFAAEKMIDLILGDMETLRDGGRLGGTAGHDCNILRFVSLGSA